MKTEITFKGMNNEVINTLPIDKALIFAKSESRRKRNSLPPSDKSPIYYPIAINEDSGKYLYLDEFIKNGNKAF